MGWELSAALSWVEALGLRRLSRFGVGVTVGPGFAAWDGFT
jgi:hypothetical protein